jgi:hypothetical protein
VGIRPPLKYMVNTMKAVMILRPGRSFLEREYPARRLENNPSAVPPIV